MSSSLKEVSTFLTAILKVRDINPSQIEKHDLKDDPLLKKSVGDERHVNNRR